MAGTPAKPDDATPPAPVVKTDDVLGSSKAGTYVVATGRHVSNEDGSFGPGEKVKLSAADATRLLSLGFILDKDGAVIVRADGPAINVEDGVALVQPGA